MIVGNPVMHHLVLGIDPTELGMAPFALATADALHLWAEEIELRLHPDARIYILPCIAGHVGADAAAVALSESPHRSDELMLVVDVGTNAEILLGNTQPASSPAPPRPAPPSRARRISSGQRAAPGAIERVAIDPVTKEPRFRVIGVNAWSDEPGLPARHPRHRHLRLRHHRGDRRDAPRRPARRLRPDRLRRADRHRPHASPRAAPTPTACTATSSSPRATSAPSSSRKSALYAGARLLMDEFGTDTVDRIVLAGAFGAHISPRHAMVLGMIPDCDLARVTSAGNAAGTGARIALLNVAARREVEALVHRIHKVETAIEPRFQEHFVAANAIPHATAPFPHLGAAARGRLQRRGRPAAPARLVLRKDWSG